MATSGLTYPLAEPFHHPPTEDDLDEARALDKQMRKDASTATAAARDAQTKWQQAVAAEAARAAEVKKATDVLQSTYAKAAQDASFAAAKASRMMWDLKTVEDAFRSSLSFTAEYPGPNSI